MNYLRLTLSLFPPVSGLFFLYGISNSLLLRLFLYFYELFYGLEYDSEVFIISLFHGFDLFWRSQIVTSNFALRGALKFFSFFSLSYPGRSSGLGLRPSDYDPTRRFQLGATLGELRPHMSTRQVSFSVSRTMFMGTSPLFQHTSVSMLQSFNLNQTKPAKRDGSFLSILFRRLIHKLHALVCQIFRVILTIWK